MSVTLEAGVQEAWQRLTSDSSPVSWIACGYPAGSTNTLEVIILQISRVKISLQLQIKNYIVYTPVQTRGIWWDA